MSSGGAAIRGSRVGAGPMGEQDRGFKAERITISYYCSGGHEYSPQYAANVDKADIPDLIDCPNCGLPAGQDKANPPIITKHEPYKTHLAYVKERRSLTEAKELLDEAVSAVRVRRIRLAEEAKQAAKIAAKEAARKLAKPAVKPALKTVEKPTVKAPTKSISRTAVKKPVTVKGSPAAIKDVKSVSKKITKSKVSVSSASTQKTTKTAKKQLSASAAKKK